MSQKIFSKPENITSALYEAGYLAQDHVSTIIFLAYKLNKPLLIEGPPGVGKTELAKSLAKAGSLPLIRLQCYEGLDEQHALYQWNYQKQLLYLQASKLEKQDWTDTKKDIFSEEFLLSRPILKAFQSNTQSVLLIDEIDKADEEFESFLLEALSDYQISIPELGTIKAKNFPLVFLTSNNSRELSDGLKRRCIHLFIDYPTFEQELAILTTKIPELSKELAKAVTAFVQRIRNETITKKPSIAEALDWAKALQILGITNRLEKNVIVDTLNFLVKNHQDQLIINEKLDQFMAAQ